MPKIIEFLLCLIETGIIFICLNSWLENRFKHIISVIITTTINAFITFLCSNLSFSLRAAIFVAITIIGSCIIFKAKPQIKVSFSIMLLFIYNIIDIMFGLLFSLMLNKDFYDVFFEDVVHRTIICLIIKAVNALVVFAVYKFFSKTPLDISRKAWTLFCLVMATFLFVTITFTEIYQNSPDSASFSALYFAVSVAFFITGMIVIYFFTHICNSFINEKRMYVLQSSYDGVKEQLAVQSSNSEKLSKIRHDMKNHLLNTKQLMSNSQYEEAENLVNEMIGQTNDIKLLTEAATGNNIVDATIAVKAAVCQIRNIRFVLKYESLLQLKISEIDLSSLFSNILDNAISAAEKTDDPYISLSVFIRGDYLNIVSENTFKGEIEKKEDGRITTLTTTKSNSSEHGFGTRIIGEIAQKYDGVCVYEYEIGVFKMNVMLKIKDN